MEEIQGCTFKPKVLKKSSKMASKHRETMTNQIINRTLSNAKLHQFHLDEEAAFSS
jgi:hypothetical protein